MITIVNNRTGQKYNYEEKENHEFVLDAYSRGKAIYIYEKEKGFDKHKQLIAVFFDHSILNIERND